MKDAEGGGAGGFVNSSFGAWYKGFHELRILALTSRKAVGSTKVVLFPGMVCVNSCFFEPVNGSRPGTIDARLSGALGTKAFKPGASEDGVDCRPKVFLN